MPLCWAHAEYITLIRSRKDGVGFDRIAPVYERYTIKKTIGRIEVWTLAHQPSHIAKGKVLRLIISEPGTVHWTFDGWQTANDTEAVDSGLDCWFVDLPTTTLAQGTKVAFTFRWSEKWEGRDFAVEIGL
jgi:glucoamylase